MISHTDVEIHPPISRSDVEIPEQELEFHSLDMEDTVVFEKADEQNLFDKADEQRVSNKAEEQNDIDKGEKQMTLINS